MAVKPSAEPAKLEPVLLIIADISGYTRYMTANAKTLSHSQTIITELVEAIIREIELPLEVAKLEGDAIFLYCRKNASYREWAETRKFVGDKLLTFFRLFNARVAELSASTACTCNACTHIEKLRLKIIVHSGEALFHRVHNFIELAGLDVIIVHRLLKNSVKSDQYLLLTDAARQDIDLPGGIRLAEGAESYEDIGRIQTSVHLPSVTGETKALEETSRERFSKSWQIYRKLWFAPLSPHSPPDNFRNVIAQSSVPARLGFAALTLLLTPLMLPVGFLFVSRHARRPPSPDRNSETHPADCSCGHH